MVIKSYDNGYATMTLQETGTNLAFMYYDVYVIKNKNKEVIIHYAVGTEKNFALKFFSEKLDTMRIK